MKRYKLFRASFRRGARGERYVFNLLQSQKYTVWYKNLRLRAGEIDLIASRGRELLFVEVKTRSVRSHEFRSGLLAVDDEKRERIIRAAQEFLFENRVFLRQRRILNVRCETIEVVERLWWRLGIAGREHLATVVRPCY